MKAETKVAATVDEYLLALPDADRIALEQLRQVIRAAAPQAEELISYQIPGYKYQGPVVYFAGFKNHLSLYGISKALLKEFEKELAPFQIKGTTVHFTANNPLPAQLVQQIVKRRLQQNAERIAAKKVKGEKKKAGGKHE